MFANEHSFGQEFSAAACDLRGKSSMPLESAPRTLYDRWADSLHLRLTSNSGSEKGAVAEEDSFIFFSVFADEQGFGQDLSAAACDEARDAKGKLSMRERKSELTKRLAVGCVFVCFLSLAPVNVSC